MVLDGAGLLAGRRYVAAGAWHGITLDEAESPALEDDRVLLAFAQSRPGLAYLRALGHDISVLNDALERSRRRMSRAWGLDPVRLDRFHC